MDSSEERITKNYFMLDCLGMYNDVGYRDGKFYAMDDSRELKCVTRDATFVSLEFKRTSRNILKCKIYYTDHIANRSHNLRKMGLDKVDYKGFDENSDEITIKLTNSTKYYDIDGKPINFNLDTITGEALTEAPVSIQFECKQGTIKETGKTYNSFQALGLKFQHKKKDIQMVGHRFPLGLNKRFENDRDALHTSKTNKRRNVGGCSNGMLIPRPPCTIDQFGV